MTRAQAWADERLKGHQNVWAAFYRAPVARGRSDKGAPWTEPFHVLIVNKHGRITFADRTDWPDIVSKQEMYPYRGLGDTAAVGAMRGSRINDAERERWVDNDEGLCNLQRRSRLSKRNWIRANRELIDEVINNVVGGKKQAHYMEYEPVPKWIRGLN